MADPVVGVIGAGGAVGRAAASQLLAWRDLDVRLAGRRGALVDVDVDDAGALARFVGGCAVIVNCAGPAIAIGDRVARAAFAAGADYVDAADHGALAAALADRPQARIAAIGAGFLPGLSALLPRLLAAEHPGRRRQLVGWCGGLGRFTPTAALDYLAGLTSGGAAKWQDGRRSTSAVPPTAPAAFFPSRAIALSALSHEHSRVAAALGVDALRWFQMFDGPHLLAAHRRLAGGAATPAAAAELVRAADLDAFGRRPYQRLVVQLDGRALRLDGADASELTGAFAALTARAVVERALAPGLLRAGEAMPPAFAQRHLPALAAVHGFTRFDLGDPEVADAADAFDEGVL